MNETTTATLELTDALVAEVREALAEGNPPLAAGLAQPLHAADLADLIELLERAERVALVRAIGPGFDPETLSYLDETVRDELADDLGPEALGRAVAELEVDDAVDLLGDLGAGQRAQP